MARPVLPRAPYARPVAVGIGELGIEPDCLAKVGNGAVEITLALVRESPLVVGDGGIFRSFTAALDDARAGGDAAIRIVPLASVPVGSARARGRGCGRKQRSGRNKHTQYAHDLLPWQQIRERIIVRSGGKRSRVFPAAAICRPRLHAASAID